MTGYLAVDCTNPATNELLQDRKSYKEALENLLLGDYHEANTGSTRMWEFIWLELMPKVVPATGKATANLFHDSYHSQVDAAALMKHVDVSDEALVLTILSVNGGSFTCSPEEVTEVDQDDDEEGDDNDSTSDLTDDRADKENDSTNGTTSTSSGKRKANGE